MAITELRPGLHFLTPGNWQVYLWRDADGLTLIDAGAAGSGAELAAALTSIGIAPSDVDRLVITHAHPDHFGGAAEVAAWGEIEVIAHEQDAPVIQGEAPGPAPVLTSDAERALHAQITAHGLPEAPPCRVDRTVTGGELFHGAEVIFGPGHTPGSIGLFLSEPGILFTGDTIAEARGRVVLGPFNADPERAVESFRVLAKLGADVACFGHGQPVVGGAAEVLAEAAVNPVGI